MKNKLDKKYLYLGITLFAVLAAGVVVLVILLNTGSIFAAIKSFLGILSPVLYGLAIAYLLNPMASFFIRHIEGPLKKKFAKITASAIRAISIAITLIVFIFIIYALLSLVLPQLVESLQGIVLSMPTYAQNLEVWLTGIFDGHEQIQQYSEAIFNNIFSFLENWLANDLLPLLSGLTSRLIGAIYAVFNFIIGVIISVYILMGKDKFIMNAKRITYSVFSVKRANSIMEITRYSNRVFGQFIIGKIIDSAIIGVLCFICMTIFQFPYAVLISVIVGITNIIPFFGPYLGAIPSIILILVVNPLQALYFAIFILVLQQIDGNIIGPRILGEATGVEGFWVVVSILVFGGLFGIVGMIIAVPTFAVMSMLINRWLNTRLKKQGISADSGDYLDLDYIDEDTNEMHKFDLKKTEEKTSSFRRKSN